MNIQATDLSPVEVRYELTEKEYLAIIRQMALVPYLISSLIFVPVLSLIFYLNSKPDESWVPILIAPLGFLVLLVLKIWLGPKEAFRTLLPQQRSLRVRFGPEYFEVTDGRSSAQISWADVTKFEVKPLALIVYVGPAATHIVPRSAFLTEDQFSLAKTWLQTRVVPAPRRLRFTLRNILLLLASLVALAGMLYQALFGRRH